MNLLDDLPPFVLASGTEVGRVTSGPYLGVRFTEDGRQTVNLPARLAKAMGEFNTLTTFWAHAGICTSLKLRTYKAIFYPMVRYALHYSWLKKSMCSRLDSWQARTLRRVLRIKASMISRVSNSEVLRRACTRPLSA